MLCHIHVLGQINNIVRNLKGAYRHSSKNWCTLPVRETKGLVTHMRSDIKSHFWLREDKNRRKLTVSRCSKGMEDTTGT